MRSFRSAAVFAAALCLGAFASSAEPNLEKLSEFVWRDPDANGLSGIEVSADGQEFTVISDRGGRLDGRFLRDNGIIAGIGDLQRTRIRKRNGDPVEGSAADAEGLACREPKAGAACDISFEGIHRVAYFKTPGSAARNRKRPQAFRDLQVNSGLEALAIDATGRLYAIPERSGDLERPFPIYRLENGIWTVPFTLRRAPPFLPVGADFGPDGKLYILERDFRGIFGFASRVRRLTFSGDRIVREETLLRTALAQQDNLEGIALWRDQSGDIRVILVSDDNQNPFQKTEIVEYRLME